MAKIVMERSGEMEVFVRVVAKGGFSAAARSLELSPSAVSKLVRRLERRLGARLLSRTTRAVALTDEGAAYFEAAQRILRDIADAEEATAASAVRGRVAVNASLPFGRVVVAPAILAFLARHPGVTVSLSFTDDVVDLMAQQADVAIRMGALPDSALVARRLCASRRVICAAPSYLRRRGTPLAPRDLRDHDCLRLGFRRSDEGWPMVEGGAPFRQPVTGPVLVNNGETLRQMALEGAGIARLGRWHVAGDLASGALVTLLEAFNPGDLELVHAVHLGGGPTPTRVRAFLDHLRAEVTGSGLFEP